MKKLQATFNAVIVKPREEEETMYGGIIVPDLGKEKALIGTIVSIGEGYHSATGVWVDTSLKVGMEVMLPSMGPNKIEFDGQEYWVCPENQVLAVIEDAKEIELEVTNK
jgi:co-chaperonin GroES (HSP10)